jgi:acetyl esterase
MPEQSIRTMAGTTGRERMGQPFVRPDVAANLKAMRESGAPPLDALGVVGARAMMANLRGTGDAEPTPLAVVRDLTIDGPGGTIAARLYDRRQQRPEGPLITFYHGGGFVVGDLDSHEPFCTYLADQIDLPVLAVDYRLAPEHPFPAAPDDAEAAARWAAQNPRELGFTVSGLITCGDSAGGNLALVVGQALSVNPAPVPLIAQWALYPYVDSRWDWPSIREFADGFMLTEAGMRWFMALYDAPDDDPRNACLLGDIPATVPLLIHTAGLDPLRDQGRAYAARARAAGAPVWEIEAEGMIHGFICMRRANPSSLSDIDAFIAAAKATLAGA